MVGETAAEKAYQAALREIERVRAEGGTVLELLGKAYAALDRIPPEVTGIEGLVDLDLTSTRISDLSPLRDLTTLRDLRLERTAVSDLSPLRNLTELHILRLWQTAVRDLSPLRDLTTLRDL